MKSIVLCVAATSMAMLGQAFIVPQAPFSQRAVMQSAHAGRNMEMVFGLFNKDTASAPAAASGGRPKAGARTSTVAARGAKPIVATPGQAKASTASKVAPKKATGAPGTKTGPSGVFSEAQMTAFLKARQEIPSSAPQYWQKIAARVPGQSPETCQAMAQKLAFDRAAGTKSNFFGGYIDVKEPEMYVDKNATPMNRFKEAFGFGKK